MKKKIIISSLLVIALCASIITGATMALFTSQDKMSATATAGKVEIKATASGLTTQSMDDWTGTDTFENGGSASLENNVLTLEKITPGDMATFSVAVANTSNVTIKYRVLVFCTEDTGLLSGLTVKIGDDTCSNGFGYSAWETLAVGQDPENVTVSVLLPEEKGNEYQDKKASLCYIVQAVQANGDSVAYDYLPTDANGAYKISTVEDLYIFASKVNDGTWADADAVLTANIDLTGKMWTLIGNSANAYNGSFDGAGHTVSNVSILGDDNNDLFGTTGADFTSANVTVTFANN